jgi:hypothetical protein
MIILVRSILDTNISLSTAPTLPLSELYHIPFLAENPLFPKNALLPKNLLISQYSLYLFPLMLSLTIKLDYKLAHSVFLPMGILKPSESESQRGFYEEKSGPFLVTAEMENRGEEPVLTGTIKQVQ